MKIHIAYSLSQMKPVLHREFHGNRFNRSPMMPAQTDTHTHTHTHRHTDRQTKNNFKNVIFVFSALNCTCWYNLFKKSKITRNFWLADLASLALKSYLKRFIMLYGRQCVSGHWKKCFLSHEQLQSAGS